MEAYSPAHRTRSNTTVNMNLFQLGTPAQHRVPSNPSTPSPSRPPPRTTPLTSVTAGDYNALTIHGILLKANLEPHISTSLVLADTSRLSFKIMQAIPESRLWRKVKASLLVTLSICTELYCELILTTMIYGLEALHLITAEDRFLTVGGDVVERAKPLSDIQKDMLKAVGCPSVPVGSFDMKYIPPRDKFDLFIQQLVAWLLNVYPALGGLIREVFETHCPQERDIIKWDSALGPTGSTMLFDLLVNRCAMDGNLLNYFSKQLVTELNGLALLQVLCSATFTYTLHTVDVHIQKLISVEPCPSVHQLSQHLTAHSNRMAVLLHMNALGDGIMARFLQIGVFKRMCEKLPVAMRIINDQERREGTEMDLPALVAELKAYADKEFKDWQAEKSIPKVAALTATTPSVKVAKAAARAAKFAATAAATTTAAVITPAAGTVPLRGRNCSAWLFLGRCTIPAGSICTKDHPPADAGAFKDVCYTPINGVNKPVCWNFARHGSCNKQVAGTCDKEHIELPECRVPPGKCLGLIHLPNNPIILKPKRARSTSRKSPTKSLIPNLINPVSIPILHTSAPSPTVLTSTYSHISRGWYPGA